MTDKYNLTPGGIRSATGFTLALVFPRWRTDGAALASYHEEHERLVKEHGWEKVIGSLCIENDEVLLGIFVQYSKPIDARVIERPSQLENGSASLSLE